MSERFPNTPELPENPSRIGSEPFSELKNQKDERKSDIKIIWLIHSKKLQKQFEEEDEKENLERSIREDKG